MSLYPLVVDLDGTLIRSDILHESALKIIRNNPFEILRTPYWLMKGKAVLKQHVAKRVEIDPSTLPYNHDLLNWLKKQREDGRKLILCTATDLSIATAISEYLSVFDEVLASDGIINLAGKHKAEVLEQRFGQAGFDYVGNSYADLTVWQRARRAVVVNASSGVAKKAGTYCKVERVFPPYAMGLIEWCKVLRIHQWLKNLLLFVPLFAAHQLTNLDAWVGLIVAFFSFSLCASSVYIINDLLDLDSDRQHPRKCNRAFASGLTPVWLGVVLVPLLLLSSFALAGFISNSFLYLLLFYFLLTCAYSWGLKRLILIDCIALAMLYTLRVITGAAVANMPLSFWLIAFSVFLFLSLAFVKRYAELQELLLNGKKESNGRCYFSTDAPLIQMLGITSGYAAVLVLALYLNSDAVIKLYRVPEFVWGAVPVMLFWVSWMWLQAHRGGMHDDPLVFAMEDRTSLLAGVVFAAVLTVGTVGWQW